ncbi:hypothetical protein [Gilvimarinus agarilyticus]|uniref:hypothetical protein n=1 Tax=Gilvimarinus agarilyticus TaxID=679259 RepID=UPI0005A19757|nr:hypothetical protein [Gilvimarinus agarilyticus]
MSFVLTLTVLVALFGLIYWYRSRGSGKVIKTNHEYFSRLWLWPKGEHTRWEAEFDLESELSAKTVGLYAEDNYETCVNPEPTSDEVVFAKHYLSDLELLFPLVESSVREGWKDWFKEDLPECWKKEFVVDGFSVPRDGNAIDAW